MRNDLELPSRAGTPASTVRPRSTVQPSAASDVPRPSIQNRASAVDLRAQVRHERAQLLSRILHDGVRAVAAALGAWIQRARSRRQLLELSDRDLRDVGLSRSDVLYEARKPFWQP